MVYPLVLVLQLRLQHRAVFQNRPNVFGEIPPRLFADTSFARTGFQVFQSLSFFQDAHVVTKAFVRPSVMGAWRLQPKIAWIAFVFRISSVAHFSSQC